MVTAVGRQTRTSKSSWATNTPEPTRQLVEPFNGPTSERVERLAFSKNTSLSRIGQNLKNLVP
jgi:hypothetical protein